MRREEEHARRARFRWGLLVVLIPSLVLAHVAAPPASASEPGVFGGSVRDSVGNLLENVEVLLAGAESLVAPVAKVRSDANGRFAVTNLVPGSYRIAALKKGYLTYVGVVNTRLDSWVDVILKPLPDGSDPAGQPIPPRATWPLRLPKRSVLRETEAMPASSRANPHPARRRGESLHVQVDQMFDVGSRVRSGDGTVPSAEGSETRLSVASQVGERGNVQVQGRRERVGSSRGTGESGSAASRDAASLNMAFSYDPTLDSQVNVRAFYNERDLQWSGDLAEPDSTPLRHGNRSWGYDAGWSRQLDERSRVAMSMNYLGSSVSALDKLNSRALGATGRFERLATNRHRLEFAFRARLLEAPPEIWRSPALIGARGFSVELDGQDTWHLSRGVSLVYGLGYRHALTSRDTSLIIPRVGAIWTDEHMVLRLSASYHAVARWQADLPGPQLRPYRPADTTGYELQLELPLSRTLRLVGSTSYAPILADFFGYDGGELHSGAVPIYLSDGNVAVNKQRFAVVHEGSRIRTICELTLGDAEGTLAAVIPYDVLFQDLDENHLDFASARLGVRVVPSGTDVMLEYRQVDESPVERAAATGLRQRALEMRLMQDLMRWRSMGYWRFLMAARMARVETEEEAQRPPGGDVALLGALNHRLSAGVSVEF